MENTKITAACTGCGKTPPPKFFRPACEEAFCPKCCKWFFYGTLLPFPHSTGGGKMKPDNATEQLAREYNGTTDFRY